MRTCISTNGQKENVCSQPMGNSKLKTSLGNSIFEPNGVQWEQREQWEQRSPMDDNPSTLSPNAGNSNITEVRAPDLAELDRERHERDRATRRGYDYDATAPSHAEFIARQRTGSGDDR